MPATLVSAGGGAGARQDRTPTFNLPKLQEPGSDADSGQKAPTSLLSIPGSGNGPLGGQQQQQHSKETREARRLSNGRGDENYNAAAKVLGSAINAGIVPAVSGVNSERRTTSVLYQSGGTARADGQRASFAVTVEEKKTIANLSDDDFFRARGPVVKQNRVIVDIAGKKFDLTEAKRNMVKSLSSKLNRQFRVIYRSTQFDNFIVKASEYILWYLRVCHLERGNQNGTGRAGGASTTNSGTTGGALSNAITPATSTGTGTLGYSVSTAGTAVPTTPMATPAPPTAYPTAPGTPATASQTQPPGSSQSRSASVIGGPANMPNTPASAASGASRNRNVLFAEGETVDLDTAKQERDARFREFGAAYCFLLLVSSAHSAEPAKERSCFETIYVFTKGVVVNLLALPAFSALIEAELTRVFRSTLFSGSSSGGSGVSNDFHHNLGMFRGAASGGAAGGGMSAGSGRSFSVVNPTGMGPPSASAGAGMRFTTVAMRDGWVGSLGEPGRPDSSSTRSGARTTSAGRSRPTSSRIGSGRSTNRASFAMPAGEAIRPMRRGTLTGHRQSLVARNSIMAGMAGIGVRKSSKMNSKAEEEDPQDQNVDPQEPDVESQLVAKVKPMRRK
ncbi:hypothetical protein HDU97_003129 [Phlyctochytrium planicorne]|nr:hypothetical protein HDU97_003080 [Phlyctochytrium planicorne]KAJ3109699.1 hypothetical protein HDU97_003129 [Phlyctochytrium planicorne]